MREPVADLCQWLPRPRMVDPCCTPRDLCSSLVPAGIYYPARRLLNVCSFPRPYRRRRLRPPIKRQRSPRPLLRRQRRRSIPTATHCWVRRRRIFLTQGRPRHWGNRVFPSRSCRRRLLRRLQALPSKGLRCFPTVCPGKGATARFNIRTPMVRSRGCSGSCSRSVSRTRGSTAMGPPMPWGLTVWSWRRRSASPFSIIPIRRC